MKKYLPMSIIIPTMNRRLSLIETLKSLFNSDFLPNEIIIIDQTSKWEENKSIIITSFLEYKSIIKYVNQDTPSITVARNKGIDLANNEIIIFSDDDVFYYNSTFINLYNIMIDKQYSMVAGIDALASKSKIIFPYLFCIRSIRKRNYGHVSTGIYGRFPDISRIYGEVLTEWAMGYFFCVKKSLITEWNIHFDENLNSYAYGEDMLFSYLYYKSSKENYMKCILTSDVIVEHRCSKEWRISSHIFNYYLVLNRFYIKNILFGRNIRYSFGFWWSNFGIFIKKIFFHDNAKAFLDAMLFCIKFRKDITRGNFHRELIGGG